MHRGYFESCSLLRENENTYLPGGRRREALWTEDCGGLGGIFFGDAGATWAFGSCATALAGLANAAADIPLFTMLSDAAPPFVITGLPGDTPLPARGAGSPLLLGEFPPPTL